MSILTLPAIYASLKAFLIKLNFLDASDNSPEWTVKADQAFRSFMFRKCNVPESQVTIPKHLGEVHPNILEMSAWVYLDHLEVDEDDTEDTTPEDFDLEEETSEGVVQDEVEQQGTDQTQVQDQVKDQAPVLEPVVEVVKVDEQAPGTSDQLEEMLKDEPAQVVVEDVKPVEGE